MNKLPEMQIHPLNEYEEAILRLIQSASPTKERMVEEFDQALSQREIDDALDTLEALKYVKIEQSLAAGVYHTDLDFGKAKFDDDYVLTPLGKNYLAKSTSNFTSFSNINNSNIAHQSPGVNQSIKISTLPVDLQEKIKELELAILKKDASAMKKAFEYIADKSVDVAIAITTGALIS